MIELLLKELDGRLKHFTRMNNMELENGANERDEGWKQRTQYFQGRIQGLSEAMDIVRKCCGTCEKAVLPSELQEGDPK